MATLGRPKKNTPKKNSYTVSLLPQEKELLITQYGSLTKAIGVIVSIEANKINKINIPDNQADKK